MIKFESMPTYIIKINDPKDNQDYYLEWSTVVDAPVTYGLSLEDFKEYYKDRYGRDGMARIDERLVRVEQTGTSSQMPGDNLDEMLVANRAGPDETEIDKEGILERYCRNYLD